MQDRNADPERAVRQNKFLHVLSRSDKFAGAAEARFEFLAEAFEKVNMLGFLAGKLQKRARPVIVARELWPSVVDDVGKNEFFNQTEHGEIFMPADLIQRPFLLSRKKGERAHPCQGFRHEWLVEIKALLSADNIFDSPVIALGNFQSRLVAIMIFHKPSLLCFAPYCRLPRGVSGNCASANNETTGMKN